MPGGWATLQLDNRTATEIGTLAAFSVSVLSVLLWRTRRTYAGFSRWMLGNSCACLSLFALAVRGVVPDWMSVVMTNGGAFGGVVLLLEGNREFLRLPAVCPPARILAGLCLLAQIYFVVVADDIRVRILVASLCIGLLTTASAVTLFRGMLPNQKLGFLFTGSFFLANAFCNFSRGIATWTASPMHVFESTPANQVYFAGMAVTVIGWAFGFILLTNDRLIQDLKTAEQHSAALNHKLKQAVEQAMAAASRAEAADQAKSDFLAYMSHEIRNPLSTVLVLSEFIMEGPITEETRPDLKALKESVRSVVGLLDDLLDLSKIEAGRMSVTPSPFDLELELVQIADLFRRQARTKSTVVRLKYAPDVPRWFQGDAQRIRQIVSNFASNAVKFTDHGEIEIAVGRINERVKITVSDTGVGIAPQALPLLFSKFTQAETAFARQGAGLGLAISKQLAMLMGGSVGVVSEQGRGSTFWVELPLEPVTHEVLSDEPGPVSSRYHLAGVRVLLAEDNVLTKSVLVKLLERHGIVVDSVPTGNEAVTLYERKDYSVVLMDCQMLEMDGFEATLKIRELEKGRSVRTPVIAITALSMAADRQRCYAAGMDDYLVKPLAPAVLLGCITAHLGRKPESPEDGAV